MYKKTSSYRETKYSTHYQNKNKSMLLLTKIYLHCFIYLLYIYSSINLKNIFSRSFFVCRFKIWMVDRTTTNCIEILISSDHILSKIYSEQVWMDLYGFK